MGGKWVFVHELKLTDFPKKIVYPFDVFAVQEIFRKRESKL